MHSLCEAFFPLVNILEKNFLPFFKPQTWKKAKWNELHLRRCFQGGTISKRRKHGEGNKKRTKTPFFFILLRAKLENFPLACIRTHCNAVSKCTQVEQVTLYSLLHWKCTLSSNTIRRQCLKLPIGWAKESISISKKIAFEWGDHLLKLI